MQDEPVFVENWEEYEEEQEEMVRGPGVGLVLVQNEEELEKDGGKKENKGDSGPGRVGPVVRRKGEIGAGRDERITLEQLNKVMPRRVRHSLTPELVEHLNDLMQDGHLRENFRENILSYSSVLQDGKYRLENYLNAVRYVSYKMLGSSNVDAYCRTFPERYQKMVEEGRSPNAISAFVAAYGRTELVNKIMEQTLVPSYILNQDLYQKALNVQADLMMNAKSEKVRTDAANSLLGHLKMPETQKMTLDVKVKEDDSIRELRQTTLELVKQQRLMIESGAMNARQVAHSEIVVEGEVVDG